ncbi:MAG TPA: hypothetical protein DDW52_25290 [Planctomycetaceae bacterium]|nr:hypothetical protein [Planctomycetaceae bacterium]
MSRLAAEKIEPQATVYRLAPKFKYVGIACVLLFSVFGGWSVYVAYFNVDGSFSRPILAATISGVFWSCWVLLGCWLIAYDIRYRLFVSIDSLKQQGILFNKTIALRTVDQATWRRFPGRGSVRLSGADGKISVDLGNFRPEAREKLITFLRTELPEGKQVGWSKFRQQFADTSQRRAKAKRVTSLLLVFFALHSVFFLALWCLNYGNEYLMFAAINAAMVGYMYSKARRRNADQPEAEQVSK